MTLTHSEVADIMQEAGFAYEFENAAQLVNMLDTTTQHIAVAVVQPNHGQGRTFGGFYDYKDDALEVAAKAKRKRKVAVVRTSVFTKS